MFWAPAAGVLFADSFLDTHCFRIRGGGAQVTGLVGLDFEPVPGREVPEITGTRWLDAGTTQSRWLDFQYVNLGVPPWLMDAEPGGRVEFRALPNGTWIVTCWHIGMFTAGKPTHPLTGRPTASLVDSLGVGVAGARVLSRAPGPRPFESTSRCRRCMRSSTISVGTQTRRFRHSLPGNGWYGGVAS